MSRNHSRKKQITRLGATPEVLAGILIGLSLMASAVLAINALYLDRGHRRAAESVIADYATFAAEQFGSRFEAVFVNRVINPVQYRLRLLGAADPASPLPAPEAIPIDTTRDGYGVIPEAAASIQMTFRVKPGSPLHEFEWSGQLDRQTEAWARDTISHVLANSETTQENRVLFDTRPGSATFLVLGSAGDAKEGHFGYLGTTVHFDEIVDLALSYGPLLPASLIRSDDSVQVAVSVASPASLIFSSVVGTNGGFVGTSDLSERAGNLTVTSSIDRGVAPQLIIGGIPPNRAPVLLGTLAVTALLAFGVMVMLKRSHELARVRSDFVSGVSHELRTPLAQIRMFAETLRLGRVRSEEEKERSLRVIDQESVRLTHLVDNLLNFSRVDRGHPGINPVDCNLAAVVEEAVETFAPFAAQKEVKFRSSCDTTIEASVDPEAVQQVLINLMDNAVKYGPAGQTVFVSVRKEGDRAMISVEDEGPGVSKSDRDKVWKRFWRSEADLDTSITGTGIGLALVREIAELHGGTASVEQGTVGARFTFSVPFHSVGESGSSSVIQRPEEAT